MKHSVTVGANRHEVFLIVNLIAFTDGGDWGGVVYMDEALADFSVCFPEVHTANGTNTTFLQNAFRIKQSYVTVILKNYLYSWNPYNLWSKKE